MKTVKGDRDANIMFTQCSGCQGLRVLFGGWANQKSQINDEYRDPNGRDRTLVEVGLLIMFCFILMENMHTI